MSRPHWYIWNSYKKYGKKTIDYADMKIDSCCQALDLFLSPERVISVGLTLAKRNYARQTFLNLDIE